MKKELKESHAQAIKRICVKWRMEELPNHYVCVTNLINRLQLEERKRRKIKKLGGKI